MGAHHIFSAHAVPANQAHVKFLACIFLSVPSRTQISSVTKAVSSGSAALEISWTAPSSDVPISGYQISYRVMSGRWSRDLALPASTLSYLIASLQPNMQYKVRVRALSPIGTGRYRVLSETTYAREQ